MKPHTYLICRECGARDDRHSGQHTPTCPSIDKPMTQETEHVLRLTAEYVFDDISPKYSKAENVAEDILNPWPDGRVYEGKRQKLTAEWLTEEE